MADTNPRIELTPAAALTHREVTITFLDLPPSTELTVNVSGPLSQPYWATLKSDPWSTAQMIWRTGAAGEYVVSAKGEGIDLSASFTVAEQEGVAVDTPIATSQTVEDPEAMLAKEPRPEPKKAQPKPQARRKPRKSR